MRERSGQHRTIGTAGLIAGVWLLVGNVTHPIGTTEQYINGEVFVDNSSSTYWVINHLLLAAALMVTPWLAMGWSDRLTHPVAQAWGRFALLLAAMGTTVGTIHLGGIDGVAIPSFAEVLQANDNSETAQIVADGLLRVHLTTVTAWALLLWGGTQVALGAAELFEGARTRFYGGLLVLSGLFGFAFAATIAVEGHLTSFSEGVLLRGATVGFTLWFFWTAWQLRTADPHTDGVVVLDDANATVPGTKSS